MIHGKMTNLLIKAKCLTFFVRFEICQSLAALAKWPCEMDQSKQAFIFDGCHFGYESEMSVFINYADSLRQRFFIQE